MHKSFPMPIYYWLRRTHRPSEVSVTTDEQCKIDEVYAKLTGRERIQMFTHSVRVEAGQTMQVTMGTQTRVLVVPRNGTAVGCAVSPEYAPFDILRLVYHDAYALRKTQH